MDCPVIALQNFIIIICIFLCFKIFNTLFNLSKNEISFFVDSLLSILGRKGGGVEVLKIREGFEDISL